MKAPWTLPLLATLVAAPLFADDDELSERVNASRAAIQTMAKSLVATLEGAIATSGPAGAVKVCHDQAPGIQQAVSTNLGISVGRTSLKVRNPNNAPDAWEKAVLEDFQQRIAAGEDITKMERREVVEQNGDKWFRYMKAIPTRKVCLACHGEELSSEVAAAIKEAYPNDQAVGFKEGELRGAFTLKQHLD